VAELVIYTIGHSNLEIEAFLDRLRQHEIALLVDVRTHPSSQRCPQFNGPLLQRSLAAVRIGYQHAGRALGGKPADPELRTPDGVPDYDRIEATPLYREGIDALCALAERSRVAIMCGEGEYRHCHREKLIARTLRARGVVVWHIQPDGTLTQEPQRSLLERRPGYPGHAAVGCEPAEGNENAVEALFTIGFTRKSLRQFIRLLQDAGVDAVVDVRRHNTSQLAGFAKRDDLEFLLRECFEIDYVPLVKLAPPKEMLAQYRRDADWESYAAAYRALIEADGALSEAASVLKQYRRPCLLCSEDAPEQCHRSLLAERLQAVRPELTIEHLRWRNDDE
jgi:uncharacterized protein (DUF488 family)